MSKVTYYNASNKYIESYTFKDEWIFNFLYIIIIIFILNTKGFIFILNTKGLPLV